MGFKAPLAYSSSFYFIARKNGVERKYMMYEGEETNSIDLLYQCETTEQNGVKIIIPVKYSDKSEFISKVKEQLCYFENIYFNVEEVDNNFVIFRGEDYQFSEMNQDRLLHLCLDNVYYPLDFGKLGIDPIEFPVALRFSLTDGLFPTPNRESLRYTKEGKDIILGKIYKVANYFTNKFNDSIKETEDVDVMLDYYANYGRYVKVGNSETYSLNSLSKHASISIGAPKLKGVELLDFDYLYKYTKDYWFGEYNSKFRFSRGKFSDVSKHYDYNFHVRNMKCSTYYVYSDNRLSGIKKDYIKFKHASNNNIGIIKKGESFTLGLGKTNYTSYYSLLNLKKHPRSQWRQMIKEFQQVVSFYTSKFIDLDTLDVPQSFIDSRKKPKVLKLDANGQVVGKRTKLKGEISGKTARELSRYVDSKHCKWVPEIFNLENLHKQPLITIYGSQEDANLMDKLYDVINKHKVRFVVFSDRELKNVKTLKFHNWISIDEFMEGKTKLFKRTVTAHLISKFRNENRNLFERSNLASEFSTTLSSKIDELNEYKKAWYINGDPNSYEIMTDVVEQTNLYDESIYTLYKEVKQTLEKLPFINHLISKVSYWDDTVSKYIADLCKYNKYKLNLNQYKLTKPTLELELPQD